MLLHGCNIPDHILGILYAFTITPTNPASLNDLSSTNENAKVSNGCITSPSIIQWVATEPEFESSSVLFQSLCSFYYHTTDGKDNLAQWLVFKGKKKKVKHF